MPPALPRGQSQINEQLVGEIDEQAEQDKLVDQQHTTLEGPVVEQVLDDKTNEREEHDRSYDRADVMGQGLDCSKINPFLDAAARRTVRRLD